MGVRLPTLQQLVLADEGEKTKVALENGGPHTLLFRFVEMGLTNLVLDRRDEN